MKEKCLLIKTKDNRKYLTHEKNLPSVIEFVKTFKAEVELVEVDKKTKILNLKNLSVALCDATYHMEAEYSTLESIYPSKKRQRHSILSEAKSIREFVRTTFLSGSPLSLKDIKSKYKNNSLTDACLCNHISTVRKELEKEGFSFEKVAAGTYQCQKVCSNS